MTSSTAASRMARVTRAVRPPGRRRTASPLPRRAGAPTSTSARFPRSSCSRRVLRLARNYGRVHLMATVYRYKGGIAIVPACAADNPKRGDMNVTARPRGRRARRHLVLTRTSRARGPGRSSVTTADPARPPGTPLAEPAAAQPAVSVPPAAGGPAAITVRGLRMSYGSYEAVRGIDFEVGRGEILPFIAPIGT